MSELHSYLVTICSLECTHLIFPFRSYYISMAMQPLLGVLKCSEEIVVQKRLQRLRAQALKCATEIAAAMGDNVSFDDAETLIAALECMNRKAASGDPVRKLFPLAWGNIW
jgi:hypothetical protein